MSGVWFRWASVGIVAVASFFLLAAPSHAASKDQRAVELSVWLAGTFKTSYDQSRAPLKTFMPASASGRQAVFKKQSELARLAQGPLSPDPKAFVYAVMLGQVTNQYPDLLRKTNRTTGAEIVLPQTVLPGAARVREILFATLHNLNGARPVSSLANDLGIVGARRTLYMNEGIMTLDNNSFSEAQVERAIDLWSNMPKFLPRPPGVSTNNSIGGIGAAELPGFIGDFGGVNWTSDDLPDENQFPEDIEEYLVPMFGAGLQHEANHVVDARYVATNAAREARKMALIARAGGDPQQYLRSMVIDGGDVDRDRNKTESLFPIYKAEFFASIANQYLASTEHTFNLAVNRFRAGKREPLNQFLFFADVYSGGDNTTRAITQTKTGDYSSESAALTRDARGNINSITIGGQKTNFKVDSQGFVTEIEPGKVTVDGAGQLIYDAEARIGNQVTVSRLGGDIAITDSSSNPIATGACRRIFFPGTVVCPASVVRSLLIRVGDRDDKIENDTNLTMHAYAGPGNDTVLGGSGTDVVSGEAGYDRIFGNGGVDILGGGDDADTVNGGAGPNVDIVSGGDGDDIADYSDRDAAVRVDLSDAGPDGAPGEQDSLVDIESLRGGKGPDVLIGDDKDNTLDGQEGNDRLIGRGGFNKYYGGDDDDTFVPGPDSDWFTGGAGVDQIDYSSYSTNISFDLYRPLLTQGIDDTLVAIDVENVTGGSGDDVLKGDGQKNQLVGCGGDDRLTGASGSDVLTDSLAGVCVGSGDDQIDAADGLADTVNCGSGVLDRFKVDPIDATSECEIAF